jgi:hypothetical protein
MKDKGTMSDTMPVSMSDTIIMYDMSMGLKTFDAMPE